MRRSLHDACSHRPCGIPRTHKARLLAARYDVLLFLHVRVFRTFLLNVRPGPGVCAPPVCRSMPRRRFFARRLKKNVAPARAGGQRQNTLFEQTARALVSSRAARAAMTSPCQCTVDIRCPTADVGRKTHKNLSASQIRHANPGIFIECDGNRAPPANHSQPRAARSVATGSYAGQAFPENSLYYRS